MLNSTLHILLDGLGCHIRNARDEEVNGVMEQAQSIFEAILAKEHEAVPAAFQLWTNFVRLAIRNYFNCDQDKKLEYIYMLCESYFDDNPLEMSIQDININKQGVIDECAGWDEEAQADLVPIEHDGMIRFIGNCFVYPLEFGFKFDMVDNIDEKHEILMEVINFMTDYVEIDEPGDNQSSNFAILMKIFAENYHDISEQYIEFVHFDEGFDTTEEHYVFLFLGMLRAFLYDRNIELGIEKFNSVKKELQDCIKPEKWIERCGEYIDAEDRLMQGEGHDSPEDRLALQAYIEG